MKPVFILKHTHPTQWEISVMGVRGGADWLGYATSLEEAQQRVSEFVARHPAEFAAGFDVRVADLQGGRWI